MKRKGTTPDAGSQPRARRGFRALLRIPRRHRPAELLQPLKASTTRLVCGVLTLTALSAITGIISYEHGLAVARLVGNSGLVAYLVPLVPDLMIVTSSLTLLEASAIRATRPFMSMLALVAGIGWTVAMNVAAGARHGPGGALLAAGIPLAFVLAFEPLLWLVRNSRPAARGQAPASRPEPPPLSLDEAIEAAFAAGLSKRQIALDFECGRPRVDKTLPPEPRAAELAAAGMNGSGS
jgi:Protein of unknown function (DUF2637)